MTVAGMVTVSELRKDAADAFGEQHLPVVVGGEARRNGGGDRRCAGRARPRGWSGEMIDEAAVGLDRQLARRRPGRRCRRLEGRRARWTRNAEGADTARGAVVEAALPSMTNLPSFSTCGLRAGAAGRRRSAWTVESAVHQPETASWSLSRKRGDQEAGGRQRPERDEDSRTRQVDAHVSGRETSRRRRHLSAPHFLGWRWRMFQIMIGDDERS